MQAKTGAERASVCLCDGGVALRIIHEVSGFRLVHFGPAPVQADMVASPVPVLPAGPDSPPGERLLAQRGRGYDGLGHVDAVCLSRLRPASLAPVSLTQAHEGHAVLTSADSAIGLVVTLDITLEQGLMQMRTRLRNEGASPILLIRCAALQLPLMDWAQECVSDHGAWAREGHVSRRPLDAGFIGRASRLGRSGFGGPAGITVCEAGTTNTSGRALGVQLAWSGSHCIRTERLRDGAVELTAEALYEPGEIILAPGETFETPMALAAVTQDGFDGLSDIWRAHARHVTRQVRRPVHFNTWEARYFEFDEAGLVQLAADAAKLGAERFVLDDGWFSGRRNDRTSLGDWTPDPALFPNGLSPLIQSVHGLGMSFGLWVEPEMVSRDSDLYRAHPEWALGYPDEKAPTGRHQLVLDLGNPGVRAYLLGSLSDLLRPGGIDYLKWDCNRELYPARHDGQMCATRQVTGLYELLDDLQTAFPDLEIESCASGGGRIDFGILPRVTRFWASDATDAGDRIRIQDSLSRYLPPALIGSHVGPSPNPITGRAFPMGFRGLAALFGHFGVELDPAKLSAADRETLIAAIKAYKRFRSTLQGGTYRVLSAPGAGLHVSAVTSENAAKALLRILRLDMSPYPSRPRIIFPGLPQGARYDVREISLSGEPDRDMGVHSSEALAWTGLDGDPGRPHHGRLFHFAQTR